MRSPGKFHLLIRNTDFLLKLIGAQILQVSHKIKWFNKKKSGLSIPTTKSRRRKQYSPSLLTLDLGFGGGGGLGACLELPLYSLFTRYNVTDLWWFHYLYRATNQ